MDLQANIEEKIIQFLSVEFILTYIRDLQYRSEISSPNIYGRESQGDTPSVSTYLPNAVGSYVLQLL